MKGWNKLNTMQNFVPLLALANLMFVVYGCEPYITSDQTVYCEAPLVFVGVVNCAKIEDRDATFRVKITSNIKGQVGYIGKTVTVIGYGRGHSCGPTVLDVNRKYIFTISLYSSPNRLEIYEYFEATLENLNRFSKFDCSCKVEVDLPYQPLYGEPAPIGDKCLITEREFDCHFYEGYCARQPSNVNSYRQRSPCQWFAPITPCL
uniref:Uncharacterized protein n=2 Tax=Magallana gigas TaxID=29159 RepID=A0A8W8LI66_MAGGI|nr:uncharacterized protein LOC105334339 [Crassostrea gigas]